MGMVLSPEAKIPWTDFQNIDKSKPKLKRLNINLLMKEITKLWPLEDFCHGFIQIKLDDKRITKGMGMICE